MESSISESIAQLVKTFSSFDLVLLLNWPVAGENSFVTAVSKRRFARNTPA
jgi:hypothetical protein